MSTKRKMAKIGTHDGSFHCDEALGCFLLKQTKEFRDAEIVRSRDPEILKDLNVVIDVGGVYDPETQRYDHHQRGFTEEFGHGFVTKLSSAGLVYKHYGREIVASQLGLKEDDPMLETVYLRVYKSFMEAIDGIDNGIQQYDTEQPARYQNHTGLSARVGSLNPNWNEEYNATVLMTQFLKAVELSGSEFTESVNYIGKVWLPARTHVKEALDKRFENDPSGKIIKLETFCPWKEHLFLLEEELDIVGNTLFCLYEDDKKNWRIQTIPVTTSSFESRKFLPSTWRGMRDDELSNESGIPGGIFVHMSGFIGGNKTFEGALAMAKKGLELS
ncbi:hypothetical protein CYMTET_42441 [Cymbomonas tetramitiformis]|uniref:Uncharacterized protein n=1 Tax=Cymbomonas tetramitiformis TaxID=36881 RepID=A0AAE0C1T4_9CHLO|nr:hypothetical protein CYMTET_43657 [Cymbomonas tetramitiformis]KAK3248081.1 hypothetical protein CYMTET_42441 [Cymbomonas tetramitiformis]